MGLFLSIRALHEEGLSKKAIARRLDVDVRTVRKYLRRIEGGETEPRRTAGPGKLERFEARIADKVRDGLSAVQIYQDLCGEEDFDASYETVKRHVRVLRRPEPTVYCRQTFAPGEEAQLDFGDVGRMRVGDKVQRVYLFVLTLCFSRLAYYELVLDQKVVTFLGALRRGFEFLGGVPRHTKPDNLRSAVLVDQLGQRYYQQDFFRFCQHYGTIPDAARPRTPTDKGRVERDIRYAKGSAFRGRGLLVYEEAVAHLARWRDEVANVRLHGTTRRRPIDLFAEERSHLRPLPADPYEVCAFGLYRVRKDCHVHVGGNYYSVPYAHVGQKVLVRQGEQTLQVLVDGDVAAHHDLARGRGQTVTDPDHYPPTKRVATQEIHRRRVGTVRSAGPHAAELARVLGSGPWVRGDQLACLARLVETHGEAAFERACARALHFGATDGARRIERILDQGLERLPLPTWPDRPLSVDRDFGRPLVEYGALLEEGMR
jgi:transposase